MKLAVWIVGLYYCFLTQFASKKWHRKKLTLVKLRSFNQPHVNHGHNGPRHCEHPHIRCVEDEIVYSRVHEHGQTHDQVEGHDGHGGEEVHAQEGEGAREVAAAGGSQVKSAKCDGIRLEKRESNTEQTKNKISV